MTSWLIVPALARAATALSGLDPLAVDPGAPPMTEMGGGSYFFAQDLGTMLRVRYNTESYGQDNESGNLDIGTMQMFNFEDSAAFFDGQVTLNDPNGVGFNVGLGYRWMSFQPYASAPGIMQGLSIWADGTSTEGNKFFPQVGLSYESLGEMWDLRANGYIPVGQDTQIGDFLPTGAIGFEGNSLSRLTQATIDTSFYVGEVEFARRVTRDRDAWAFAGPYFLANDDTDTLGYRAGMRGYAYPDLLLQIAVSNDDIFETNAAFTLIWFVGRTRTHFQPACGVPDRFREPVMRNDYVALAQTTATGGIPLTDAGGGELRIVHVNSNAAPGGDGTFENPFDMLTDADGVGSVEGDIIFVHSNSVFSGQSITLKDDQRLLGEGLDADGEPVIHTLVTFEEGTINIPESSPGARNDPRPMINAAPDDAVTLANRNEVANFDFDGGNSAIFGTGLTGNSNLHDLGVTNTAEFAISLVDTATTSTITLDDFNYDGGTTGGGVELNNFDGTFTATNSTIENGTQQGLFVHTGSDGTITFDDTVTFTSVDGTAVDVNGLTGSLTVEGVIANDTGQSVSIQGVSDAGATVTLSGDITDTGEGILVNANTDGIILFTGDLDLDTDTDDAITVTGNNNNADINFAGLVDITTTSGAGFTATGGGTLTVSGTTNSISSTTGTLVDIQGMTVSNIGVNFADLNRSGAGTSSAVVLMNNTGGPIRLGTVNENAGQSGTIAAGTGDAIVITNSANVTVSALTIANSAGSSAVRVEKSDTAASTVNLNDLAITGGDFGVEVIGGGTGALTMTLNDTAVNGATDAGILFSNVDAGTIQVNNADVDGNNVNATADGVRIQNSDASITFNDQTSIQEVGGDDFEVSGGAGTISFAGDIVNVSNDMDPNTNDTSGRSVNIHNVTGGSVTFTPPSSIRDDNEGMLVENNSGGMISFLGTTDLDTEALDAVTVRGNTGNTDVILDSLDITTTSGDGVVIAANASTTSVAINNVDVTSSAGGIGLTATGAGDLTVSGNNNVISTTTGTGVVIDGMNIVGSTAFEQVTVNGAANGIVLNNVTGAQVTIGEAGGIAASGGTLNTTDDAIVLTNVANVDVNNVLIDASGGEGIAITHNNAAAMDVTINDTDVDQTTGDGIATSNTGSGTFNLNVNRTDITNSGAEAFDFTTSGSASDVNVRIDTLTAADNFVVNAADDAAVDLRMDNSTITANTTLNFNTAGNVDLLIEDSLFDAAAGVAFQLNFLASTQDVDAIIRSNDGTDGFVAGDASAFVMTATGTGADIDFLLDNNRFSNSSAASETVDISVTGGATVDANITNNSINQSAVFDGFAMLSDGTNTQVNLNLDNNSNNRDYELTTQNQGVPMVDFNFSVVDRDNTDANNAGTVNFNPNINEFEDIAGPVEMPVLP